jgi:hypothetical protein
MGKAETCSTIRYSNKVLCKTGCNGIFYLCIHSTRDDSAQDCNRRLLISKFGVRVI